MFKIKKLSQISFIKVDLKIQELVSEGAIDNFRKYWILSDLNYQMEILIKSTKDLGHNDHDSQYGNGLIDAFKAVKEAIKIKK